MLRQIFSRAKLRSALETRVARSFYDSSEGQSQDEKSLKEELNLTGVHFDDIDKIMCEDALTSLGSHFPNLDVDPSLRQKPSQGHNLVVIQPWVNYANFGENTDPDLQLAECVSLGNTIHNWNVIGKKIVFGNTFNRNNLVGHKAFHELKDLVFSHSGVTAVFFGVEILSGVQLLTLEKELRLPVYDRFTVVLNIIRQHARSREAKIQLALAELPYIKSHLKEIGNSSDISSTDSLKLLVGGAGERSFFRRMNILKSRESKLKYLLEKVKSHRDVTKKLRQKRNVPTISIVGYTNSGKTSLVKYLAQDKDMMPKNELFATLDVTAHGGHLPSCKDVIYIDTVGFISRIPMLLVEAFSTSLKDIRDSNLILHVLDISHPDHKLQQETVIKALGQLQIPKSLMKTRLTVGNKVDLLSEDANSKKIPRCDIQISVTEGTNMSQLINKIDSLLMTNVNHQRCTLRIGITGNKYTWLRKYSTIIDCQSDEDDANFLICRVMMSQAALGRWRKLHGIADFLETGPTDYLDDDESDDGDPHLTNKI